ncbi:DUF397 domain-containing protein [Solihabitans fulvus]|uniref:DUF397 domain-containing protein n=1 Tax=Solihabitans fulvus TaxID=1892852 RepID=A0A5B2XNX9_9PSEU|nr:DUF397 domain-containing protein [Solihabitans fulvus]KAA2264611.1 DUF397 domain-containing protein [Solihabitans fulvus]
MASGDLIWRKSSHSGAHEGNVNCVEIAWRKSSHSGGNEGNVNCIEIAWRKSSRSGADDKDVDCVEVAPLPDAVAVRDSKNPSGPMLVFPATAFAAFTRRPLTP